MTDAVPEHHDLEGEDDGGGGGEGGGGGGESEIVGPPLVQPMTPAELAEALLRPGRLALLGRSSNKSTDFWRWCIGKMVSSSQSQWQHMLLALSMHR